MTDLKAAPERDCHSGVSRRLRHSRRRQKRRLVGDGELLGCIDTPNALRLEAALEGRLTLRGLCDARVRGAAASRQASPAYDVGLTRFWRTLKNLKARWAVTTWR